MDWRRDVIGDLQTYSCGGGPPIVLIHGFGATSFTWSKIAAPLAARHTLIAVDLKGFGRSVKPKDGRYSLHDQAAAVLKVIAALGLRQLTLVGHSMGGGVALLVAARLEAEKPGWLSRLVLIDAESLPQALPLFLRVLRVPLLGRLVVELTPPNWAIRYVLRIAYFDRSKIEDRFVAEYAAALRSPGGRAALIATAREIVPPDAAQLVVGYRTIRVPVLLLWGNDDRIVPVSVGKRLEKIIPGASLRRLPCCGHIPQEEWPAETLSLLESFLLRPVAGGK